MFGSSGHKGKPQGLVIENFTWRAKIPGGKGTECVKSICIPECVSCFKHPHYPIYKKGFFNINTIGDSVPEWFSKIREYTLLQLNHYFTKSKEEWIQRHSKGYSCMGAVRTMDDFNLHDNNDVEDNTAASYANAVKEILKI